MRKKYTNRLHTVCGIVTAVLVLLAGICFILSCISIYRSGDRPFSPESVANHFKAIRVPVFACIVSIAVSGILALIFPKDAPKPKAIRAQTDIINALRAKAGTITDEELAKSATREQSRRKYLSFLSFLVYTGIYVRLCLLFTNPAGFTVENLNQNVLQIMLTIMVYSVLLFGSSMLRACLEKQSLLREIAVYKAALAEGKCDGIPTVKEKKTCKHTVLITRCILFAIAAVFIVLGIFNGGVQDVLGKAIAICTECIGLG